MQNLPCDNEFYLQEIKKNSYQWRYTNSRFETEAWSSLSRNVVSLGHVVCVTTMVQLRRFHQTINPYRFFHETCSLPKSREALGTRVLVDA